MKKMIFLGFFAFLATACGEQVNEEVTQTELQEDIISEEDLKDLEEEQNANVELEQLDGELDSLLNTL